ncbi:LytTR family transcriptional regulator [Marinilongibacter aquaticus]|uniref:LytTR family DNA-binding domain-containing protein n=1 Tax=Marinilongibacter aquaticus TaxID=2975157 RepID=UPI0021BD4E9F|nr:LytTR family DNA-binding domain-containing protein [Marinilongibacter aquaticus]UBM58588.1 LytTR family transcriptional regulator [Marinilongibacter aquaticus]
MKTCVDTEGTLCLLLAYGKIRVPVSSIAMIRGDGNYSKIYQTNGKEFLSSFTLGLFVRFLNPCRQFFLVNKGLVLNMDHVGRIVKKDCGLFAEMRNGERHPLSRRRSRKVLDYLQLHGIGIQMDTL